MKILIKKVFSTAHRLHGQKLKLMGRLKCSFVEDFVESDVWLEKMKKQICVWSNTVNKQSEADPLTHCTACV